MEGRGTNGKEKMPARLDLTGDVYGQLKVVSFAGTVKARSMWNCECQRCGSVKEYALGNLRSGASKQCLECAQGDRLSQKIADTRAYYVWKTHKDLDDWCQRWDDYENFLEDMGHAPEDKTFLVRRYPKRSFCKSNCYWHNRRRHGTVVNIEGHSRSIQEWAEFLRVSRAAIYLRINNKGESPKVAVLHFFRLYSPVVKHQGRKEPLYGWARHLGVETNKIKVRMDAGMSAKDAVISLIPNGHSKRNNGKRRNNNATPV